MTPARRSTLEYLRRPRGAPWQWTEEGRVLAWTDGTTVAFREEIKLVIERLAPSGLPAFAEIALLLAACRSKVPELPNFQLAGEPAGGERQQLLLTFEARRREQIKPALEALRSLGGFPPELLKSAGGKAALVEAVLESRRRYPAEEAKFIAASVADPFTDEELNDSPPEAPALNLIDALHHVGRALLAHSPESLRQRMRTGLDALPRSAEAMPELPADERARRLLGALRTDEAFAGLALAARDLMAALQLPQLLAHPDELALGGSSDVSNRGSLDRLLISELVHDDATLAARVALNEALYLQREPPAHRPARSLVLILDVGVRMWGTPRVLGAAAALALVARHHSKAGVSVFRAAGVMLEPVELLTREGLETHLARLRPEAHPGGALPAIARRLDEPETTDLVVLTHRDVIADEDFQRAARELAADRIFALTAGRDGAVQLWPLPWVTPRPLCEATVEIKDLLSAPRKAAKAPPLIEVSEDPDYPAIFRVRPFPLLLPVNAKMEYARTLANGVICVTSDHRLLRWKNMQRGARQLATDLPGGRTQWVHPEDEGVVIVKGRSGAGQMAVIFVPQNGEPPKITRFTGPQQARAVFADGRTLVLILHTRAVGVDLATGELLAEHPIEAGAEWIFGRYFRINGRLAFACWDGAKVRWESAPVSVQVSGKEIKLAFDRTGVGPWLLMRDGRVLSPLGSEHAKFPFPAERASLSDDHEQLTASFDDGARIKTATLNLGTKTFGERRPAITPPTRNLQKDFITIARTADAGLRLQRRKGKWLEFFPNSPDLRLVESPSLESAGDWQSFTSLTTPPRLGCGLKIARWADGSRAWLDSRGLLHLRSADRSEPEMTLTLNSSGPIAAWCSDGLRCGPDFFHPESDDNKTTPVVVSRIDRFGKIPC